MILFFETLYFSAYSFTSKIKSSGQSTGIGYLLFHNINIFTNIKLIYVFINKIEAIYLMKVPFSVFLKATSSSSSVFITIGPRQGDGFI